MNSFTLLGSIKTKLSNICKFYFSYAKLKKKDVQLFVELAGYSFLY